MLPVVVQPVLKVHWGGNELVHRQVVERGEMYRQEVTAHCVDATVRMRGDAAAPTKAVMAFAPVTRFSVVGEFGSTSKQSKVSCFGVPHALFPAEGAVALAGALVEVNVGLEGDRLAVAAAVVCAFHGPTPIGHQARVLAESSATPAKQHDRNASDEAVHDG